MDTMVAARSRQKRRTILSHLRELWQYRELVLNLTIRELKARYKSSVLGFFWSLLNPLGMMVVFTVVFTILMPNNQIEKFPIFLLCGLLPWNFFTSGWMTGTSSIVTNAELVKKVYFPREILPIASALSSLVNFLLALIVLFAALIAFKIHFSPYFWLLPLVILIQTCFVMGMALIFSTINVFYRDTLMVMDVVVLAWFFLTPVFYPTQMLPTSYTLLGVTLDVHRVVYILNPMASLIGTYRDLLYWGYRTNLDFFLRTALTSVAVLAFGYWLSVRFSGRFAEEV